jgi:hypothetical protein
MIDGVSMQRRSIAVRIVVCALVTVTAARHASAQQQQQPSPIEIYGGYSFLQDPGNSVLAVTAGADQFRAGWIAGVARPLSSWLAIVGEASGHYKQRQSLDDTVRLSFHALMAGPRASARLGRLTEFAQVLAGAAHGQASAFGIEVATTALSVQPGGGVDVPIGSRWAARLEIDYRWIRSSRDGRESASQLRASAALVFR